LLTFVAGCHLSAIGQRVGGLAHLGQKVGLCQLAAVAGFALPSDSDAIALEVAFTIAQAAHNDLDDVTLRRPLRPSQDHDR
jgi:hypothetical protein